MRVVLAHCYYRSSAPSGEDAVFRNERELLANSGVDVIPYELHNDDIDDSSIYSRLVVAKETAWSARRNRELSNLLTKCRPDVVHFHNTFPQMSPSVYAACRQNGIPVVQTLHNFRLVCPGALLLREGRPCEECLGNSLLPALRHRCYRGSLAATGALVWMLSRGRMTGIYQSAVNRYIALTNFAAGRLAAGGLPRDRIAVKPNFLPMVHSPGNGEGGYGIYVGRLSDEKGVRTLIEAWEKVKGIPLKILGEGPLRRELEQHVVQRRLPVEFMGYRSREKVLELVGKALFQVVPSNCYEGFPMAVLEAYASGTPVIASAIGSLDEIVINDEGGLKFVPRDADDLARKVLDLTEDKDQLSRQRRKARAIYEQHYTPESNLDRLFKIYQEAGVGNHGLTSRSN